MEGHTLSGGGSSCSGPAACCNTRLQLGVNFSREARYLDFHAKFFNVANKLFFNRQHCVCQTKDVCRTDVAPRQCIWTSVQIDQGREKTKETGKNMFLSQGFFVATTLASAG